MQKNYHAVLIAMWLWVIGTTVAYLYQFRSLIIPIANLLGIG